MLSLMLCSCMLITVSLTGCGGGTAASGTEQTTDAAEAVDADQVEEEQSDVDVDLAAMSGTMVYSEVYNMMSTPDDYIGKTVRMKGTLAIYHDDNTGKDYYSCVIQDATACCAQGMEFILNDPADYPSDGEEITVTGVFDTYMEGEYRYCTLKEADLI